MKIVATARELLSIGVLREYVSIKFAELDEYSRIWWYDQLIQQNAEITMDFGFAKRIGVLDGKENQGRL